MGGQDSNFPSPKLMNKKDVMATLSMSIGLPTTSTSQSVSLYSPTDSPNYGVDALNSGGTTATGYGYNGFTNVPGYYGGNLWDFWYKDYYPIIIRESYPIYLQERSMDSGKKAFEIIKLLQDKKLIKLDKVSDFIEAMDCLIKAL